MVSKSTSPQIVEYHHHYQHHHHHHCKCKPVRGASISTRVFSCLIMAAPSLTILRATSSVTLPSAMKCCFKTSGLGRPLASNTSLMISLLLGGKRTAIGMNATNISTKPSILVWSSWPAKSFDNYLGIMIDKTSPKMKIRIKNINITEKKAEVVYFWTKCPLYHMGI